MLVRQSSKLGALSVQSGYRRCVRVCSIVRIYADNRADGWDGRDSDLHGETPRRHIPGSRAK